MWIISEGRGDWEVSDLVFSSFYILGMSYAFLCMGSKFFLGLVVLDYLSHQQNSNPCQPYNDGKLNVSPHNVVYQHAIRKNTAMNLYPILVQWYLLAHNSQTVLVDRHIFFHQQFDNQTKTEK